MYYVVTRSLVHEYNNLHIERICIIACTDDGKNSTVEKKLRWVCVCVCVIVIM